ncbi:MAG: hypothetical protein NT154_39615 [Verrucomicrobia bacterium]|nr:hypothetical protein [Verrucomicrobiota bacterium]
MDNLAIYIPTTPHDYYLAKALVASIRHYSPGLPIYILPSDSYEDSHLFGCPVWRPSDPRVMELDGYCTKLRTFWGPAERFIYLDADMLFLKAPAKLLALVADRKAPFLMACAESKFKQVWRVGTEGGKRLLFEETIGRIPLINEFDACYDWRSRLPFNGGFVAAHRDVLDREGLLDFYQRAERFHARTKPPRKLSSSRNVMFNGDQGILQYYLAKTGVQVEYLDDAFLWGGDRELWDQRTSLAGEFAGLLIHWAGCPRPGLLRFGIPGGKEWKRFYLGYCRQHSDYSGLVREVIEERIRRFKEIGSRVKRAWLASKA